MEALADARCEPCRQGSAPLGGEEMEALLPRVPGWSLLVRDGVPRLERAYAFPDFAGALAFANRVGAMAEEEGHHPALTVEWGSATVSWWTHAIGGLHRNDFVMAARTDRAVERA